MLMNHGRGRMLTIDAAPGEYLTAEQVLHAAPAVFQEELHSGRSPKHYRQTSVAGLFEASAELGIACTQVKVASVRQTHRDGFQKHILRFERLSDIAAPVVDARVGEVLKPSLYALNSHDGTTGHAMWVGAMRMICENGLMSGEVDDFTRTRHTGAAATKIASAMATMIARWATMQDVIAGWKTVTLSPDEYYAYAQDAAKLRWGDELFAEGSDKTVRSASLIRARREEDKANDLWTMFNRVQENLIRGGVPVTTTTERGRRVVRARGVQAIEASTKLNRELWSLTKRYAALQ